MKLPSIHRTPWSLAERRRLEQLLRREWLVTNGLGGYASGTVAGISTRRYHGLLVPRCSRVRPHDDVQPP